MTSNSNEKFWINDPCVLLRNFNLLPEANKTLNEKLNALTRIVIIATVVMYCSDFQYWLAFLVLSIMGILVIKIMADKNVEGFSIPPTYVDGAEPMSTVPPIHAEEWQVPPPMYDEYTNAPPVTPCGDYEDDRPIFGQYVSSTRLFPYQNAEIANKPLNDAQLFMNDEFTRDTLQFRNDMTRTYINKLDRFYRHGCWDPISPYNTY